MADAAIAKRNSRFYLHRYFQQGLFLVSRDQLIADLDTLREKRFRNRAAHIGLLTRKEAEDCRELTLSIVRNLMNRPFGGGSV
ncbi:MAG: hypothetical protein R3B47_00285 [Bacteroidia bacterium]